MLYPSNIVLSSTHDGYRISACDLEILIQQQVLYPVRDTASVIYFVFFKGRKGLLPVQGLFLLQFSHHLHNITHTWFNKSRWEVNPHRAGCQLPGELHCNYAALQPKPSAGKVWRLAASLTGLFQAIQIAKGALFLSFIFLFATSSQLYHFLAWLLFNHKINVKPLTSHSVKMYSTSSMENGERISDAICSKSIKLLISFS